MRAKKSNPGPWYSSTWHTWAGSSRINLAIIDPFSKIAPKQQKMYIYTKIIVPGKNFYEVIGPYILSWDTGDEKISRFACWGANAHWSSLDKYFSKISHTCKLRVDFF